MNKRPSSSVAPRKRPPRARRAYYPGFEELLRKDLMSSLGLWFLVEFISFLVLPALMGIDFGDRLKNWFSLSIPLGIGGAIFLSMSSRFMAVNNERNSGSSKQLSGILGQAIGILGFLGILFPFLMVTGEFISSIFN